MQSLTKKLPLLVIALIMLGGWLISSCKKESAQVNTRTFLTNNGIWRLASVRTELLHGDTSIVRDTLNTDCTLNQTFSFNTDGSCAYVNFHCLEQASQGTWQLTFTDHNNGSSSNLNTIPDSVLLQVNMVCKDTSAAGSSKPFAYTQVFNLGQNSMILQAVKTDTLRKTPVVVLRRRITRYGFIH